jgi:hypothetical protein
MANVLTQNPVRLDTAMLSSYKTQTLASLGSFQYLKVEKILWETPITVGDQIIFEDNLANVLVTLTCDTANVSQCLDWSAKPKRWADFTLTKISSGVVWLYLI